MSREIVTVQMGGKLLDIEVPAGTSDEDIQRYVTQSVGEPERVGPNQLAFEIEQMARQGHTPDSILRFIGNTAGRASDGTPVSLAVPPEEIEGIVNYYRSGGNESLRTIEQRLGPDGQPSTRIGAALRGAADMVFPFTDELGAAIRSGAVSGPEYEQEWANAQTRRWADDPTARGAGQAVGLIGSMAAPAGLMSRVGGGMLRQSAAAAGVGAGMGAAYGIGNQSPDTRFDNVEQDALLGAALGPASVVGANAVRSGVQAAAGMSGTRRALATQAGAAGALGGGASYALTSGEQPAEGEDPATLLERLGPGVVTALAAVAGLRATGAAIGKRGRSAANQSAADDILKKLGITPADFRRRAATFQQDTGRSPSVAELLTTDEALALSRNLVLSPNARQRAQSALRETQEDARNRTQRALREGQTQQLDSVADADDATILNSLRRQNEGLDDLPGPRELERRVAALADKEFEPLAREPVPVDAVTRQFFEEQIIPNLTGLRKQTLDDLQRSLANGMLTGADIELMRRGMERATRGDDGLRYTQARDKMMDYFASVVPGARVPVENFARRMQVVNGERFRGRNDGGAVLGRKITSRSMNPQEFVDEATAQTPLARQGVGMGTRADLAGTESISQSYELASRIATEEGMAARLYAALPREEADALIRSAVQQKQAIDAISALARIPAERIAAIMDNMETGIDALAALGPAGAGFRANTAVQLMRQLGVGRGAADKLAEDLFNPARRERVFQMLESAGLPRMGLRQLLQGAFLATGAQLMTADRVNEGMYEGQTVDSVRIPE